MISANGEILIKVIDSLGSLDIAPTRNCIHFLKHGFVVAKGINEIKKGNCKRKSFMHTKIFITFQK